VEEEIAERHRHCGSGRPVPEYLELKPAKRFGRAVLDRDPHPVDRSSALDVGENLGAPDRDRLESVALPAAIFASARALRGGRVFRARPARLLRFLEAVKRRRILAHRGRRATHCTQGDQPH